MKDIPTYLYYIVTKDNKEVTYRVLAEVIEEKDLIKPKSFWKRFVETFKEPW